MFDKEKKYFIKNFLKEKDLLPEDVLIDSIGSNQNKKLQIPLKNRNFIFIYIFSVIIFVLIMSRTFYLQVIKGNYYNLLAENNKINYVVEQASRGVIYDRNGVQLVQNIGNFDLVANANEISGDKFSELIDKLSEKLDINKEELYKVSEEYRLSSDENFVIKKNLDLDKALTFEALSKEFTGLHLVRNTVRNYLGSEYFSHIIGYTGKINKEELAKNNEYSINDYIGKMGIELSFESELRGINGVERQDVDSLGNLKRSVLVQEPQAGNNVILTIDSVLQKTLYDALQKSLIESNVSRAAAVAVNPQNGNILAIVSLPSFDNNLFAQGVSLKDYNRLLYDVNTPLLNRAIAGEYPPGSTFKPLVAVAMLEENILDPNTYLFCPGSLPIKNKYDGSISYKKDWKAHGNVNMYDAIAESCNVYFYTVGGGYGDIEGLGNAKIKEYAEKFGFGSISGIDLMGEKKGFIPDEKWKESVKGEKWYDGDTYNISIGQGDLLATPLQLAMYTAAISNGGILWKPKIVDKIANYRENILRQVDSEAKSRDMVSGSSLFEVKKGMRETVRSGSASHLSDLPIESGAKTGTAQYGDENPHAWFTCFAPFDKPEIAISIIVEKGGEGSRVSLPVAKEVLKKYFN